jgi:hypothetical protein
VADLMMPDPRHQPSGPDAGQIGATVEAKAAAGVASTPTRLGAGFADQVHPLWAGRRIGSATLDRFAESMREAGQAIVDGLAAAVGRLADALAPITAAQLPEPELTPMARALARKRRPFTCHRHGVQPEMITEDPPESLAEGELLHLSYIEADYALVLETELKP